MGKSQTVLRSPIKWAGGKSSLVSRMQELRKGHENSRWVDPFCGACTLPLNLDLRAGALLADINPALISFWLWVQGGGRFQMEYELTSEFYYAVRDSFNASQCPEQFYFLMKTCYNGLARFSQREKNFNTPFGKYKSVNFAKNFQPWQDIICDWQFKAEDYKEVLGNVNPTDWIFADPPYLRTFSNYYGKFLDSEQNILANLLAKHPGPVVACNSEEMAPVYYNLGFTVEIIEAPRLINCNGDRTPAKEMFAYKNIF